MGGVARVFPSGDRALDEWVGRFDGALIPRRIAPEEWGMREAGCWMTLRQRSDGVIRGGFRPNREANEIAHPQTIGRS